MSKIIRLGLIGDNIAASCAPDLHEAGGRLHGLNIVYKRLVPKEMGLDAVALMRWARDQGFCGLNITHPYKEVIAKEVFLDTPLIKQMGAVNTLVFEDGRIAGFNTDYSGFVKAWLEAFSPQKPGRVALMGAGGAGRAVAFGLAALGAEEIRIFDRDRAKAEDLCKALSGFENPSEVRIAESFAELVKHIDGIVNCTPVGMVGNMGTLIGPDLLPRTGWAFDAVYTPLETEFLRDAQYAGLDVLSGFELFFHQGVDAFKLFTGVDINQAGLRQMMVSRAPGAANFSVDAP